MRQFSVKPKPSVIVLNLPTPDGVFTAAYSEQGLCGLNFPGGPRAGRRAASAPPPRVRAWHALTAKALTRALSGRDPGKLPPLDLSSGTTFQQQVWRAMRRIKAGRTRSYGEIAGSIAKPGATRAVGSACGANPLPVLIPCHRVLAAGGKLGGFSAELNWKRSLLAREGASYSE